MYRITKRQYEIYIKEVNKWIDIFGLKDWEVFFMLKPNDDTRSSIGFTVGDNICEFILNEYWSDKPTTYLLKKTAFHEVVELLFGNFRHLAYSRFITEDQIDAASHALIRTFENVVFDKEYKGKEDDYSRGKICW